MGRSAAVLAGLVLLASAGAALAQPPADVEAKLREMGRVIAPNATARLYAPMFPHDFMAGVTATKDLAFGSDPKQKLNVYAATGATGAPREVLVFMPGGQGVKQMDGPEGAPFYDNIGAWGAKNGLVVVITQYRTGAGASWDAGAKDIASTLEWVKANIAAKGGDPNRIVLWGQSNGATQLATWLGHADLRGPAAGGVKGAILMSGGFNIAPIKLKSPPAKFVRDPAPEGAPPPPAPMVVPPLAPEVMLQRSNLEGIKATSFPIMLVAAELDPEERVETVEIMTDELTKAGHPPVHTIIPGHSHISEVNVIGTADHSVETPLLNFVKSVK